MVEASLVDLLAQTELFAELPPDLVKAVAKVAEFREYKPGKKIVRQGDEGHELFIIATGSVNVLVEDYALWTEQVVLSLGPGQSFGEASLLTNERRSATVQAKEDTVCAVLSRGSFEKVLVKVPQVALTVSRYLAKRLAAQCKLTGFRFATSEDLQYDPRTYRAFPESILRQCEAIPIGIKGRTVTVALTRPNDLQSIKLLQNEVPGLGIEPVACTSEDYAAFMQRYRSRSAAAPETLINQNFKLEYHDGEKLSAPLREIIATMLSQSVSHVIIDSHPASDHPLLRRDGFLEPLLPPITVPECSELRKELQAMLALGTESAGYRSVSLKVDGRAYYLAVSMLRGCERDRYSLELTDSRNQGPPISALFPSPPTLNLVRAALGESGRIILLTGDKGSGLSTTLRSLLEAKSRTCDPRNILLLEERPIMTQDQYVCCKIDESLEQMLTVADLQRPDLIAVDSLSVRHLEELVFHRIAQPTLLATYHGDDLLDRLARVAQREGGRAPSLHRIRLILDQRLVRKICSECRSSMKPSQEDIKRLEESKLHNDHHRYFQGSGCVECGHTGVSGVVPIFEALSCSRELLEGLSGQRLDWAGREKALRSSLAWSYRSFTRLLIAQGIIDPLEGLRMFAPVPRASKDSR